MTEPFGPIPDEESEPYWSALAEHRLVLQRCTACERVRFPRLPACPWCGSTQSHDVEASGRGEIYSWVTVHRALSPETAGDVPYTIAAIALAEGGRVFARLDDISDPAAGTAVSAKFVDHPEWTELRFERAEPSP